MKKYITKIIIKPEEKTEMPEYVSLVTTRWGDLHVYGDAEERLFVIPSSELRDASIEGEITEEQTEVIRQRIMEVIRSARLA